MELSDQPDSLGFDVFAAELSGKADSSGFFVDPLHPDDRRSKEGKAEHERHVTAVGQTLFFDLLQGLHLEPADPPADLLPLGAYLKRIDFVLGRDYVSKDDPALYPMENSIRRDPVFKTPMVSGSTWKGSLRSAAVELLVTWFRAARGEAERVPPEIKAEVITRRTRLWRIFGDEKTGDGGGEYKAGHGDVLKFLDRELGLNAEKDLPLPWHNGEAHFEGRLHCLPTFFNTAVALDVLNPRDRKTRAGTVPITLETVPAGTPGTLSLLYLPYDRLADGAEAAKRAANEDWPAIAEAIRHTLLVAGFGGKRSNSCGTAQPGKDLEALKTWLPFPEAANG